LLAHCNGALRRRGLLTGGELDVSAIGAVLQQENATQLTVGTDFPDAAIEKCNLTA
jgi:hypothetical protein